MRHKTILTLGANPGRHTVTVIAAEITPSVITFNASALEEPPHIAEDINSDGIVNILDIVWVSAFLGQVGESRADVNGDGVVNIQDIILVARAFGERTAPAPALD